MDKHFLTKKFVIPQNLMGVEHIPLIFFIYFGAKFGDENKQWAPHKICYVLNLTQEFNEFK